MNGRKSKLIRKLAQKVTIGKPNKTYKVITHANGSKQVVLDSCTRKTSQEAKRKGRGFDWFAFGRAILNESA